MIEERERACDEAVLERGHDGGEYASGILAVCRHCSASSMATATATAGNLTQRVRYILGDGRPAALGVSKAFLLMRVRWPRRLALPMIAGAVDGTAHRLELLATNSRVLGTADYFITPVTAKSDPQQIVADREGVLLRNTSLRDLIALA